MSGRQWWWLDRNSARRESGPGPGSGFRKSRAPWIYNPLPNSQRKRRKVTYDKSVVLHVPPKNENLHILIYFDTFWRIRRPRNDERTSGVKLLMDLASGAWRSNETVTPCCYYLQCPIPSSKSNALVLSCEKTWSPLKTQQSSEVSKALGRAASGQTR